MNDRSLRDITCGLGGTGNGVPRQSGYDITVASEIMAVFCLSSDFSDLQKRIGNIVIGYTRSNEPVRASQLNADGAIAALLKDAFQPNLVQTLENNPAFIHGGPFANIAHGCNSVVSTKAALKLADYVVTEAGFGADLGAEKFFDIKCRKSGLKPDAVVLVATTKALKMHGGIKKEDLGTENVDAVTKGCKNLEKHIENIRKFGVPVVVAINDYVTDTKNEHTAIIDCCKNIGVECKISSHWKKGGLGAVDLAEEVAKIADSNSAEFKALYDNKMSLWNKTQYIAQNIYGAADIIADKKVRNQFKKLEDDGFGEYPICMAKTQYSFSTDPLLMGAPSGHDVPIREVRLSAGAEFIVVVCGEIMTMPGLPKIPAAENINVDDKGLIQGLF
jgi:formate--tetrahydrofolate ligase